MGDAIAPAACNAAAAGDGNVQPPGSSIGGSSTFWSVSQRVDLLDAGRRRRDRPRRLEGQRVRQSGRNPCLL